MTKKHHIRERHPMLPRQQATRSVPHPADIKVFRTQHHGNVATRSALYCKTMGDFTLIFHCRFHIAARTVAVRHLQVSRQTSMQAHRRHPRFPRLLRSVLLSFVHLLSNLCLNLSLVPLLSNLCLSLLTIHHVLMPCRFAGSIRANMARMRPRPISDLVDPGIGFLQDMLTRPRPMSDLIYPRVAPGIGFLPAFLAQTPKAAVAARTRIYPSSCAGGVESFKTRMLVSFRPL